jgi:hypothetical protein
MKSLMVITALVSAGSCISDSVSKNSGSMMVKIAIITSNVMTANILG